jgi:hypothetical protein
MHSWLIGCGFHPTTYQGVDDIERPKDDKIKEEDGAERGKGVFQNNLTSGLLIISGIVVTMLGAIVVMAVFIFFLHGIMCTLGRTCDHTSEERILEGRKNKCIIMHLL